MRFNGNTIENLISAKKSKDEILVKDLLVDEMSNIIQSEPKQMIKALRNSKVKISDTVSKQDLISIASYNLYNNPIFQKNLAVTITNRNLGSTESYANSEGGSGGGSSSGGEGGGEGGGGAAGLVSALAGMIGSIGQFGAARNELKAEELRTKSKMYEKIFGKEKKTNWLPIAVIGGVLLIGALVVWRVTANK